MIPISMRMKRAVLCVPDPQNYIDQLDDYSIMIINPAAPEYRQNYLLDNADWSLKITNTGYEQREGADYNNEKLFWYTSGTTGDSKFCSFSQNQIDLMAKTICNAYDITSNDRYVTVMPLWHAHGQGFYWATRQAGCETHFITFTNVKDMITHRPTFVTALPDLLNVIGQLDLKDLRFIRGASAPMDHSLFQKLSAKFGVPVIEAFGMTEALSHCFTNPLHGEQRIGTVGLPDGIEARIDQDSRLWIRGPCMCQPDWYDTGDLAQQDEKGYFQIVGRSRDQVNIKGYKINPASIETQLKILLPKLKSVAVFGHAVCNCVYVGDVESKVVADAMQQINLLCRPRLIKQLDQIPLSQGDKISRSYLCKLFACK